ncbi:hypothetical protein JKP88DRAFT_290856 [Tribonema minus]|uniref:Uncharacterized protein n=1 Tax=Tribonema minus TaxID=303371 RepID=A0A836CEL2_9STRA|nr:hypothetical protein JKP88DRAFT_290856 [Tribonema minus]
MEGAEREDLQRCGKRDRRRRALGLRQQAHKQRQLNMDQRRAAKGASPAVPLSTPLQIFSFGAFHGGVWRLGFKMDTIGEASILMYLLVKLLKLLVVADVSLPREMLRQKTPRIDGSGLAEAPP